MTTIREIIGQDEDGEPADELDNCDLAAVFHHDAPGHAPLPAEDAMRLWLIGEQLRAVLKG